MAYNWPFDDLTVRGKVGIGTETPTEKLEVIGNLKLQAGVAVNEFSSNGTFTDASDLAVPTQLAVKAYVDSQIGNVNSALSAKAALGGSTDQDFAVKNLTVHGSLLKVVGNLEVEGTTTFRNIEQYQGDLELGDEDTDQVRIHGIVLSTHSSGILQIESPLKVTGTITADKFVGDGSELTGIANTQWSNGAGGSISYSGGNVGIGTASPYTQLTLTGSLGFANATTPMMYVFQSGTNNSERPIIAHSPPYVNWGLSYRDADDTMIFQSGGTPVMAVGLGGQKVGIGITTPVAPLHIVGGNWNPNDTEGDLRLGDGTYRFKIGIARGGAGAGDVRLRAQGGTNRIMIGGGASDALVIQNNDVSIPSGRLSFGAQVRQMINLWQESYGIGVQGGTQYFRSGFDFCWFKGGSHNDARNNPGGGVRLMALNEAGDLILSARTNPEASPSKSLCRALVDLGNKLVVNLSNDYSLGVDIVNGRFVSSRELKKNIDDLSLEEAVEALHDLNPVKFSYKTDTQENLHVGFIAEDVPELLASPDKKSIGSLDVVAVLTKVVQEQQKIIAELAEKVKTLEKHR